MTKQKHIETIVDELPDCNFCTEEGKKEKIFLRNKCGRVSTRDHEYNFYQKTGFFSNL